MEIRNKVKERKIVQMDLADYKPSCAIVPIDLSEQLWKGLVLKEKDFRAWIKETEEQASNTCTTKCWWEAEIYNEAGPHVT